MAIFEIFTDSSCDLPEELIEKYNLHVMQLEVIIDDKPPVLNNEINIIDFYEQLRAGANAKTAAVTPGFFDEEMRKCIAENKDILYIGFSSGLSVTYSNGLMIMNELRQEFPERKLYDIDTLCASVGQGLLVCHAAQMREEGASIEEVRDRIEAIKQYIHHQVTVDDLFFLMRGGRISTVTAIAGSVLKFKPIIVVDENGKLNNIGKVRGRKTAIKELFSRMKSNEKLEELKSVFISHSDCRADVDSLVAMIKEEWENVQIIVSDIGPVIGAHTGPGTIALCYLGTTIKGSEQ